MWRTRRCTQIKTVANVTGEQLVNIGSQDMDNAIWLKLAARTQVLLDQPDVDAVVITHGTDTMEETSYFLSLTVKTHKPIVLVGSMRPATSLSADGPMNLYEAVLVAASPQSHDRGTLVVMNDQIKKNFTSALRVAAAQHLSLSTVNHRNRWICA